MVRAGIIMAAVTLVLGSIGGLALSGLCIACLAVAAGLGAGYLAGQFDRPAATNDAAKRGAGAGAIGGVGALLAHLIAGVSSAVMLGPEGAAEMLEGLGLPAAPPTDPTAFYASAFGSACCFGIFEVVLMAALGAVGGLLWAQIGGKRPGAVPPAPPAPSV